MTKLEMIRDFNRISTLGHKVNKRITDIKAIGKSIGCEAMARVIKNTENLTFPSYYSLDPDTKLTKADIKQMIDNAIVGLEMVDRFETMLLDTLVYN